MAGYCIVGGIIMADNFDIGAKVRIKQTFSKYSGERGVILAMRAGPPQDSKDKDESSPAWLVQVGGGQEVIPENEMELIAESEI